MGNGADVVSQFGQGRRRKRLPVVHRKAFLLANGYVFKSHPMTSDTLQNQVDPWGDLRVRGWPPTRKAQFVRVVQQDVMLSNQVVAFDWRRCG